MAVPGMEGDQGLTGRKEANVLHMDFRRDGLATNGYLREVSILQISDLALKHMHAVR